MQKVGPRFLAFLMGFACIVSLQQRQHNHVSAQAPPAWNGRLRLALAGFERVPCTRHFAVLSSIAAGK
jgi:hypothetical protein